jgi:hypothetical protein
MVEFMWVKTSQKQGRTDDLGQPFSTFLCWRNPSNNFQVSENHYIKIIIKVGSGFNANKGCKLTLISVYNMAKY